MPTDYEIATSDLLYYPKLGFEVKTPLVSWYEKNQMASALDVSKLQEFHDPSQLNYTKYVEEQARQEIFLMNLFRSISISDYDKRLPSGWIDRLELILSPARFLFHGLQMVSSYIGSMSPNSQLVIALMFQAANEMKTVQIIAYRIRQIQMSHKNFGVHGRETWEDHEAWQPPRRYLELLLAVRDWTEALVALNMVFRPKVDEFFLIQLSAQANQCGDTKFGEILNSLVADSRWRQSWLDFLTAQLDEQSKSAVKKFESKWKRQLGEGFSLLA